MIFQDPMSSLNPRMRVARIVGEAPLVHGLVDRAGLGDYVDQMPLDPPPGCHFHPRCPHAFARCGVEVPRLRDVSAGQSAACHLLEERV